MEYSRARPISRRGETGTQLSGITMASGDSYTPSPLGALRPGTGYRWVTLLCLDIGILFLDCFFLRGSTARPPSSLRGGTASRLTAANSMLMAGSGAPPTATSQRIGTAIGYAGNVCLICLLLLNYFIGCICECGQGV